MKMMKMRKSVVAAMMLLGLVVAPVAASVSLADDPAPAAQSGGSDLVETGSGAAVKEEKKAGPSGFWGVVTGSGALGVILWLALFLDGAAAIYFTVDCWVLIKPQKLMPQTLINNVQGAVAEGDVMKAVKACEAEPSPMANVLAAAFQHVEDGYDVIQESVNAAADLEIERIMQRLTWISVCSNLAPFFGLLGTVWGIMVAFFQIGQHGSADLTVVAPGIAMALITTVAGLVVAIPASAGYNYFTARNGQNEISYFNFGSQVLSLFKRGDLLALEEVAG